MLARTGNGVLVTRIGMAHDAGGRVVPQHALDPARRFRGAVAHHDHAGVLRVADADAAAVVERNPGCASGATWVSFHHGGGVGIGFSQHAGMVVVCDGTPEAARRIERVLWNDPASGVMRHADAGYEDAIACAREHKLKLPSLP